MNDPALYGDVLRDTKILIFQDSHRKLQRQRNIYIRITFRFCFKREVGLWLRGFGISGSLGGGVSYNR